MTLEKKSRRAVLQTVVASALLTATPFSVLEAMAKTGKSQTYELDDGSSLLVRKAGKNHFKAERREGDKVDKKPSGSFKAKTGELIVVVKGDVRNMLKDGETVRGGEDSWRQTTFWQ
jgi:hypothetical protein